MRNRPHNDWIKSCAENCKDSGKVQLKRLENTWILFGRTPEWYQPLCCCILFCSLVLLLLYN
jgi:hypothetical protein